MKEAIENAFEKMPEDELIKTAIEKRLRLKGRPQSRDELKKFNDYLLRRGFSYDLIRDHLSTISKIGIGDEPAD